MGFSNPALRAADETWFGSGGKLSVVAETRLPLEMLRVDPLHLTVSAEPGTIAATWQVLQTQLLAGTDAGTSHYLHSNTRVRCRSEGPWPYGIDDRDARKAGKWSPTLSPYVTTWRRFSSWHTYMIRALLSLQHRIFCRTTDCIKPHAPRQQGAERM